MAHAERHNPNRPCTNPGRTGDRRGSSARRSPLADAIGPVLEALEPRRLLSQSPYGGSAWGPGATVEAEHYDFGGEGVAYHDTTAGNASGSTYRAGDGADVQDVAGVSNGREVGSVRPGEWLEYTVDVPAAGTYTFEAAAAYAVQGGTFHAEFDGGGGALVNKTGTMTVPNTGGYHAYAVVSKQVQLAAGVQTMRVVMDARGYYEDVGNFDWFRLTAVGTAPAAPSGLAATAASPSRVDLAWQDNSNNESGFVVQRRSGGGAWQQVATPAAGAMAVQDAAVQAGTSYEYRAAAMNAVGTSAFSDVAGVTTPGTSGTQFPYGGTAAAVPGTVEAENFDEGGPGVAYADAGLGNNGSAYRATDVDVAANASAGNGHVVGWTSPGEWLEYTVSVAQGGVYDLSLRVASGSGGGTVHLEVDGTNATGPMVVPNTGGWGTWQTLEKKGVSLAAGTHVLRLSFDSVVYQGEDVGNVDWLRLTLAPSVKLGGAVIGTPGSYGNGTATRDKAFDGDLGTFFDAPVANGAWVGLDLGAAKAINRVKYAPRHGWAGRMVGGKFQGSNTADFSAGVVDLFTVSAQPANGQLAEQAVGGTFRYIRYLAPAGGYGNVAEVEFHTPQQANLPPAAPTNLTAAAASATRVDLAWADNATDETGYRVLRSTDGSSFTEVATLAANVAAYADASASAGTLYYYRVVAFGAAGASAPSNTAQATTPQQPAAPAPASDLTAAADSPTSVTLAWADNSADEAGFRVERRPAGGAWSPLATAAADAATYSDAAAAEQTAYEYRVVAFSAVGDAAASNVAAVTTPAAPQPPAAPTELGAVAAGPNQVELTWTDNAADEAAYRVLRSDDGTAFSQVDELGADATAYGDATAAAEATYYYRVVAVNAAGTSAASNTVQVTTPRQPAAPAPASDLTAAAASTTRIVLDWADNSDDEDFFRIERRLAGGSWETFTTLAANVTSLADETVDAGSSYDYRVVATNAAGDAVPSNVASATVPLAAPAAPGGLTASAASATHVDLAWTDNSADEADFQIERRAGGGEWQQVALAAADATAYADTAAAGGTAYSYRVRATNAGGVSGYSNVADVTTPVAAPDAPSDLAATTVSPTRIDLAWADNSDNETGFQVERSTDGVTFAAAAAVPAGTTFLAVQGLGDATQYHFRVRATNAAGGSPYSNTAAAATPLAPASDLTATALAADQVGLAWADNSGGETGHRVQRREAEGTWADVATLAANETAYTDAGVEAGTAYEFRVVAFNAAGDALPSAVASVTTPALPQPPAAPTDLTAVPVGLTRIDLAWADNAGDEAGYRVMRSADGTSFAQVAELAADASAYSDATVAGDSAYLYRVVAFNAVGESAPSNTVQATTPSDPGVPAAPTGLSATAAAVDRIDLAWTDNADNEDGFRLEVSTDGAAFVALATVGAGTARYAAAGLDAGTTYHFRLRAYNVGHESANSAVAHAKTLPTAPAAPSDLTAVAASNNAVDLSWADNADNEEGYRIEQSTDGASFTQVDTVGPDVAAYAAGGLQHGRTYHFRVRAFNAADDSAYTSVASATTTAVPPAAPSNVVVVSATNTKVTLGWADNAEDEGGYRIEWSTDGTNFNRYAYAGTNAAGGEVTGLSPDATYYFRVRAYNNVGQSDPSAVVFTTTTAVVPTAPTGLTAAADSDTSITLSWLDNSGNEDNFRVERSADGTTFTEIGNSYADRTSYTDRNLTAGSTYYYRVRARNTVGDSAYSNVSAALTLSPPNAPEDLAATAVSNSRVELTWADRSNNESGFRAEWGTDGTTFNAGSRAVGSDVTNLAVDGLAADTLYYFRVLAQGARTSAPSNAAPVTTLAQLPAAPTGLTAASTAAGRVELSWTDNADNEDGFELERSLDGVTFTPVDAGYYGIRQNRTQYTVDGLDPATTYHFRLRATNGVGDSEASNAAVATTSGGTCCADRVGGRLGLQHKDRADVGRQRGRRGRLSGRAVERRRELRRRRNAPRQRRDLRRHQPRARRVVQLPRPCPQVNRFLLLPGTRLLVAVLRRGRPGDDQRRAARAAGTRGRGVVGHAGRPELVVVGRERRLLRRRAFERRRDV